MSEQKQIGIQGEVITLDWAFLRELWKQLSTSPASIQQDSPAFCIPIYDLFPVLSHFPKVIQNGIAILKWNVSGFLSIFVVWLLVNDMWLVWAELVKSNRCFLSTPVTKWYDWSNYWFLSYFWYMAENCCNNMPYMSGCNLLNTEWSVLRRGYNKGLRVVKGGRATLKGGRQGRGCGVWHNWQAEPAHFSSRKRDTISKYYTTSWAFGACNLQSTGYNRLSCSS